MKNKLYLFGIFFVLVTNLSPVDDPRSLIPEKLKKLGYEKPPMDNFSYLLHKIESDIKGLLLKRELEKTDKRKSQNSFLTYAQRKVTENLVKNRMVVSLGGVLLFYVLKKRYGEEVFQMEYIPEFIQYALYYGLVPKRLAKKSITFHAFWNLMVMYSLSLGGTAMYDFVRSRYIVNEFYIPEFIKDIFFME